VEAMLSATLAARDRKYLMMNAPEPSWPNSKDLLPGPGVAVYHSLAHKGMVAIHSVRRSRCGLALVCPNSSRGCLGHPHLPIEKVSSHDGLNRQASPLGAGPCRLRSFVAVEIQALMRRGCRIRGCGRAPAAILAASRPGGDRYSPRSQPAPRRGPSRWLTAGREGRMEAARDALPPAQFGPVSSR